MHKLLYIYILFLLFTSCDNRSLNDNPIIEHIPEQTRILVSTDDLSEIRQYTAQNSLYTSINDLKRIQEIEKTSSFLKNYTLNAKCLIALSLEGRNKVVITLIAPEGKVIEPSYEPAKVIDYNGNVINQLESKNGTYFTAIHKGFHIASSSQLVVESIIRREVDNYVFDESFAKLYSKTKNTTPAVYVNAGDDTWLEKFILNINSTPKNTSGEWFQLSLINSEDIALELDGLLTYDSNSKQINRFYNNIKTRSSTIENIAPANFSRLKSISYGDSEKFLSNIKKGGITAGSLLQKIISNTTAVTEIQRNNQTSLIFSSEPSDEGFFLDFNGRSKAEFLFQDYSIYELKKPLNTAPVAGILTSRKYNFAARVNDYFIFAETAGAIESIIENYSNKSVMASQSWWKKSSANLSSEQTVLEITSLSRLQENSKDADKADYKIIASLSGNTFPYMISQYNHEDNFATVHISIPGTPARLGTVTKVEDIETSDEDNITADSKTGSYQLTNNPAAGPFLFPNHNTGMHDIIIQDDEKNLILISEKGMQLWSKQLDGQILGEATAIDALKNGKKQILVNTSTSIYLLDRDGRMMPGFPIRSKNAITKPVSVFDYDNRRDYRILAVNKKQLALYDVKGQTVSGFEYDGNSEIVSQPQHIKSGNNDYIAFAKADKTIALLNRQGKVRTKVSRKIDLQGDLQFFKKRLIAKTKDGNLLEINIENGAVSEKGKASKDDLFIADGSMQLLISNNKVSINSKLINLPEGTYKTGGVTQLNDVPYAFIEDAASSKVYILNKKGVIQNNKPIYGNQTAISQSKYRYAVTQKGKEIAIYRW